MTIYGKEPRIQRNENRFEIWGRDGTLKAIVNPENLPMPQYKQKHWAELAVCFARVDELVDLIQQLAFADLSKHHDQVRMRINHKDAKAKLAFLQREIKALLG